MAKLTQMLSRLRNVRFAVATLAILIVGCGQGFKSVDTAVSSAALTSTTPVAPSIVLAQAPAQTTNLGTQLQIPIQITGSNYSGAVNLKVANNELNAIDTGGAIKFSFNPATVTVAPGATATSTLTVNVTTMAPSFNMSLIRVEASDATNPLITATSVIPFQVKAIFDVYLRGPVTPGVAAPENFSIAVGSTTGFISHPEGLLVRFDNLDSEVHLIHSSGGPIPHESTTTPYPGTTTIGLPPSPDGGKTAGGVYAITVPASATSSASQVYCHFHESTKQARTLQFNLPVTPTSSSNPANNPNATFTYINNNILKTSCNGCHSGGNPAGGIDLSSYAAVASIVVKGKPASSSLYLSIAPPNPNMPLGAKTLSSTLVQDVADWITLGAPNN